MNFTEAFLEKRLSETVACSMLNRNLTCKYEITIWKDITEENVMKQAKSLLLS